MPHLPLSFALTVKLTVWICALIAFLRLLPAGSGWPDARAARNLCAVLVGAFLCSKLVHGVTYATSMAGDPFADALLAWLAGDSIVGALLGGRIGLWLADRSDAGRRVADALTTPVIVALLVLACGSVGWALRGAGVGGATDLPWGMDFGDGVARHPLMLYEAVWLCVLAWADRRTAGAPVGAGRRAALVLFGYFGFIVLAGYLKAPFQGFLLTEAMQPRPRVVAGIMTPEQWLAACAMFALLPGVPATLKKALGARGNVRTAS